MRGLVANEPVRAARSIVAGRGLSLDQVDRSFVHYRSYELGGYEGIAIPPILNFVGGVLTDEDRVGNPFQGDGLAFPDSSVGLWQPCNFNYHNSGGAETGDLIGY